MIFTRKNHALLIYFIICLLLLVQGIYFLPLLPDQVANHFDLFGQPDSYSSKAFLIGFYYIISAFVALLFVGIGVLYYKLPESSFNIPNRQFWLSASQKATTLNFMFCSLIWFGSITLMFIFDIFNQIFRMNIHQTSVLSRMWLSVGIFLIITIAWVYWQVRYFKKPR